MQVDRLREVFIFKLINPSSVPTNLVDLFIQLIKKDPELNDFFGDFHNTTFILTHDKSKEIYGGALLQKKKITSLPLKMRKALKSFSLPEGNIWTCTICFQLKNNNFPPEFEVYFKDLYQDFYEMLSDFGNKEKTSILYMRLQPGEYLCSEAIGIWPYRLEIRPTESDDRFFHAILPLVTNHQQKFITYGDEKTLFSAAS